MGSLTVEKMACSWSNNRSDLKTSPFPLRPFRRNRDHVFLVIHGGFSQGQEMSMVQSEELIPGLLKYLLSPSGRRDFHDYHRAIVRQDPFSSFQDTILRPFDVNLDQVNPFKPVCSAECIECGQEFMCRELVEASGAQ